VARADACERDSCISADGKGSMASASDVVHPSYRPWLLAIPASAGDSIRWPPIESGLIRTRLPRDWRERAPGTSLRPSHTRRPVRSPPPRAFTRTSPQSRRLRSRSQNRNPSRLLQAAAVCGVTRSGTSSPSRAATTARAAGRQILHALGAWPWVCQSAGALSSSWRADPFVIGSLEE